MDETFEQRALIEPATLRALLVRSDVASGLRLGLHLACFVALCALVWRLRAAPLPALSASLALAWVWATLFAPFHECTHRTAFRSRRANAIGAWLTAIPFMMAPAVYRTFHFEHHRHTQDPARDPELSEDPRYAHWPTTTRGWLLMASGVGLLLLKLRPLLGFACRPRSTWPRFAPWAERIPDATVVARESRIVLAAWLALLAVCVGGGAGTLWLLLAAWFAQGLQALWFAAEHTGLPQGGSILARTRTVTSNPFVRFWLWNMNFHAEHHAWPGLPWHRLPVAHHAVADALEARAPGYVALHRAVLAGGTRPRTAVTGAPASATSSPTGEQGR
ncbi:MAG: fatty acid desaturase [Gammaproteobacteria bacterium]